MTYTYDTLVYIGRFQPFHNAHLATVLHALTLAKKVVIVIGSANQPRDPENPFTQVERCDKMILPSIKEAGVGPDRVYVVNVENTTYNNTQWALNVVKEVEKVARDGERVGIIGHTKDESSFYLNLFPQWGEPIEMPLVEVLDATTIRSIYFSEKNNLKFFENVVPPATLKFLEKFMASEEYKYVCDYATYIENYKKPYAGLPYPVSFNTGDAVVIKAGHVLMVKRRAQPGKGLMALPGGFLNAKTDRSLLECAIRELYEETKIKVPEKVIRGSIKEEKVFDAAKRSLRGRVITTAQLIVLDDDVPGLPKVKGSDDAEKAVWVPIHKVRRIDCFEDHYDILQYFVGRIGK